MTGLAPDVGRLAALAVLISVAMACGTPVPSTVPELPSTPVSSAWPQPTPTSAELAEAAGFRLRYGLRADADWIRQVAAEPSAQRAIDDFGFPLMPHEYDELISRRMDRDLLLHVQSYGDLFPDDYAGAYQDQATGGVIASFARRVDRHRAALEHLFRPGSAIDVRAATWSSAELRAFMHVVEAQRDWFGSIGTKYLVTGRRITEDFVYVQYLGPAAAALMIETHFGGPTWLRAERSGPLPWTGPRGDLVIDVVDASGRPVPEIRCDFQPEDEDADEGGEDIFGTGSAGRCTIKNLPAVAYRVFLQRWLDDRYVTVKELRVRLRPDGPVIRTVIPGS